VAAFSISQPLEGRTVMPEETDPRTSEQPTAETEETVEQTATEDDASTEESTEPGDGAQEAQDKPDDTFDRKRFEAELRKKNNEAANLRKRLKELEPLAQKARELEDAQKTETERLADQLRAATEQITATRKRLVRTQVTALAQNAFADVEDPLGELDLESYIDSDGDIDEAAIKADLDALLERKPHWAKPQPQEGPRRPAPDRTQASGAKQTRTLTPQDEFSGWLKSQLK
jgi:hypothetical protein